MIMSGEHLVDDDAINISVVDLNVSYTDPDHRKETYSFWSPETLLQVAPVLLVMVATIVGNVVLIVMLIYKKTRRIKTRKYLYYEPSCSRFGSCLL